MANFEVLTGPSGATELVLPIRFLRAGDKWMGSTVESIRQLWDGGNFLVCWVGRDGNKNCSVESKNAQYQKIYLELAA